MFRASLDAIRSMLKKTFPQVTRIYVNTVPTGFKRSSFFVQLVADQDQHLNKAMYNSQMTWQIVYFAPVDSDRKPATFNQYDVAGQLKDKIMGDMILTSPDGTIFSVLECDGGPRDAEVYITVKLEIDRRRSKPQYDIVATVDHDFKEG